MKWMLSPTERSMQSLKGKDRRAQPPGILGSLPRETAEEAKSLVWREQRDEAGGGSREMRQELQKVSVQRKVLRFIFL